MILSGPNDCRGSINDDKILPHFLHSAVGGGVSYWSRQTAGGRIGATGTLGPNLHAIDDGKGLLIPMAAAGVSKLLEKSCR